MEVRDYGSPSNLLHFSLSMAQNAPNPQPNATLPGAATLRAVEQQHADDPLHIFYTDDTSWHGSADWGIKPHQSEIPSAINVGLPALSLAQSVSLHFDTWYTQSGHRPSEKDLIFRTIMEALTTTEAPGLKQLSVSFNRLHERVDEELRQGTSLLGRMDPTRSPALRHLVLHQAPLPIMWTLPSTSLVKLDIHLCPVSSGICGLLDMLCSLPSLQELSLINLRFDDVNPSALPQVPQVWADCHVQLPHLKALLLRAKGGPRTLNLILYRLDIPPSASVILKSVGSPPTQMAWEEHLRDLAFTLTTHFRGHAFERLSLSIPALDLHASSSGSLGPLRVQFGNLESRLRDGLRIFLVNMPALQVVSKLTIVPFNANGIRNNGKAIHYARETLQCLRDVEELEIVDKRLNRVLWDVLGPTTGGQLHTESAVFPWMHSLTATMDRITPTEWRLLAEKVAWRKELALREVIIALWGSAELAEVEVEQLSDTFGASINARVSKLQEPPEAMVELLKANESSNTQTGAPATEGPDDSDSEDIDTDSDY